MTPPATTAHPVTLLIGPVASAKTTLAYHQFRAAPPTNVRLLVPGAAQRTAARAALELTTPDEQRQVATLTEFARWLVTRSGQHPTHLEPLARQMQIRARVRDLLEADGLPTLQEVALKPGMLANVGELLRELFSSEVDLERLSTADLLPYDGELARLARVYRQHLADNYLTDDEQTLTLAMAALREHPAMVGWLHLLVLDSFDQFTPQQISLLLALAQCGVRLLITLTGDTASHPALIRFERTRTALHTAFAQAGVALHEQLLPTPAPASNEPLPAAIAHLRQHLFRLEAPPPVPAAGLLHIISAADREREVRALLRQVHLELAADTAPAKIAILLRRTTPAATALLREVAAEYGIPLNIASGRPLLESTAALARLALLRLPATEYPLAELAAVWRSFADGRLPADLLPAALTALPAPLRSFEHVASLLDRLNWQHGVIYGSQIMPTLEQLARQHPPPDTPPADSDDSDDSDDSASVDRNRALTAAQAQALLHVVQALQAWLATPPHSSYASFIEWAHTHTLSDTPSDDPAVLRWQRLLNELRQAATLANEPDLSLRAFLSELQAALRDVTYQPVCPAAAVQVLTVIAARGQLYDVVALPGLLDGEFPRSAGEPVFYNRTERALLQSNGLPLPLPYPADERTIYYEAVTRTSRRLILSYPYLDERGNQLPPSPYIAATEKLYLPESITREQIRAGTLPTLATAVSLPEQRIALLATPPAQRPEPLPPLLAQVADEPLFGLLEDARNIEREREGIGGYTHYEGMLRDPDLIAEVREQFSAPHQWSVTRLNDYITCPYRFAAAHLLRLQAPREPQQGLERAGVGRLYHAILQRAGAHWQRERLALEPGQSEAVLAALQQAIEEVLASAPADFGFAPGVFWEWEQQDVARRLSRAVRLMLKPATPANAPQIAATEQTFGMGRGNPPLKLDTPAGTIHIQGRIDRIDQYPDLSLGVIDYKSGSTSRKKEELENARDVQAAVYLYAVQELFASAGQPVQHVRYLQLGSGTYSPRITPNATLREALTARLAGVLAGVQAGDFSVRPRDECPPTCAFMSICRRNLRKRDAQQDQI